MLATPAKKCKHCTEFPNRSTFCDWCGIPDKEQSCGSTISIRDRTAHCMLPVNHKQEHDWVELLRA